MPLDRNTLAPATEILKAPEVDQATKRHVALMIAQMVIDDDIGIIDGTWPTCAEEQLAWWLDLLGLNHREIRLNSPNDRPMRRKTELSLGSSPFPS